MSRTSSADENSTGDDPREDDDRSLSDDGAGEGAAIPSDPEEDALDLADLDGLGMPGKQLANASGAEDELVLERPHRKPRSPILSLIVIAFSAYLLATMWPDFSYWLQSSEPEDLGHASDFVRDGRVPAGYHDTFVVLEGTPDVQHAARMTTDDGFVGYLRVTEGDGQLFAAIPRGPEEKITTNFEGRYAGRMRRLGSDRAFPWLEQFFEAERVTRSIDTTPEQLAEALRAGGEAITVDAANGSVRLGPQERVRLVLRRPEARVQMGVTTFPSASDAEARIAALGLPYAKLDVTTAGTFHSFIVRIPAPEREAAKKKLVEGLDVPEISSDPKVGVAVLPMTATFTVPASALELDGDRFTFPYGDNTSSPGYEVQGERLVESKIEADEPMRIPLQDLAAVRLEKRIELDPDGYLIVVGADPSSARTIGILWLVTLGLGLVNVASLLLWWRRRHQAA